MAETFITAGKIITGCKSIDVVGKECVQFGKHCLLVTGARSMKRAGITDHVIDLLKKEGVETTLFSGIANEPTVDDVDTGRKLLQEHSCDVVIGLGGGSAIDTAKAIAGLAFETEPTEIFLEGKEITNKGLPFVAIPTTAGTGSEVTPNSVIIHPRKVEKKSIRSSLFLARVVIVDPELTYSMPRTLTAHTGMDALTQAIESFISIHATPITEALSVEAFRLIARSLVIAYQNGADRMAREDMAYGSLMAGMALANARLGVVHGIAHPIGARYHLPHGLVCGVLLPHAMRLNAEAAKEKFDALSSMLGKNVITFVENLVDTLGIPKTLAACRIEPTDFPAIIKESMPSGSLKANPKKVTEADVEKILREITA